MSEKPWTGAVSKVRSGSPAGHLNDEFWGMLEAWLEERLDDLYDKPGTVTGTDGGTVKVHLDDEDVAREVGFPAAKGVRYNVGDRVVTRKGKGGARMVLGRVDGSTNQSAVDTPQLYPNSVTRDEIKSGEVTNDHLAGGIGKGKLEVPVQNLLDKADSAIQNIPDSYVEKDELNRATAGFITKSDLPDTSGLASKTELKNEVKKLNTRIDRLEKRQK